MAMELVYMLSVFLPWIFPFHIINQIFKPDIVIGQPFVRNAGPFDLVTDILSMLLLMGILNKDFVIGQSPVKRMGGYQVVNDKTMQPASKIRSFIRNITVPIWPIEVIMISFSPERRLGDFIAGTRLIDVPPTDPELITDEIVKLKWDAQTTFILFVLIILITLRIMNWI